ncbi:hypothetical protein LTR94_026327, partial [Friedmanniomyces endolithicus]
MRVWNPRTEAVGVDVVDAEAGVGFSFLRERFSTWVRHDRNLPKVEVGLLRGPFKHLNNRWEFHPHPEGTRLEFMIDFVFKSRMLDLMLQANFDLAVGKLIGCFEDEARRRGLSVLVLEKEGGIGQGVSSRNSEVVHGGLYYPTGSLKAKFCVEGRRALYAYLESRKIDHWKCGKLVVATEASELDRLDVIYIQAKENDVEGLERLSSAQVHALEPELRSEGAILSPESGIFDSHGYMSALEGEIQDAGGSVVANAPFVGASPRRGGGFDVRVGGGDAMSLSTRLLVTAPGLNAQAVADRIEGYPSQAIPKGHYGKGVYFRLRGPAPFNRLIYPPPIPGAL